MATCGCEVRDSHNMKYEFYVLLTAYPNITKVFHFYQLDAQILYFNTFIAFCTCFEQYCAHIQEDKLYNTASGIVTLFVSLFRTQVTIPLITCVLNSDTKRVTIPDAVLYNLSS